MPQRRKPARISGPFKEADGYRYRIFDGEGGSCSVKAPETAARLVLAELTGAKETTVARALDVYLVHLKEKGNRPRTIATTLIRLRRFFSDSDRRVCALTSSYCAARYEELRSGQAVDTHRNTLAEAKTFARWLVKRGLLRANPLEEQQGVGRRRHGKPQLTIDEARRWYAVAYELADHGEDGAVAALLTVELGLRASEVVTRLVRDVDDGGRVLRLDLRPDEIKTPGGAVPRKVPEELRPHLLRLCEAKLPAAHLFAAEPWRRTTKGEVTSGRRWRDWPREWVQRICELAQVPRVTAQGMRGLRGTLDVLGGGSVRQAQESLRHEHEATTRRHYLAPGTEEEAQTARLKVLRGGKG